MSTDNTIISTGNTFRIYDSTVETYSELPLGTYKVRFHPQAGYSLERVADLTVGEEKVYGTHDSRLRRIFNTYDRFDRSMGVILSGDKGMGKSLLDRMIATEAIKNRNLPVVIVDCDAPGIADFIDMLGEAVVIFDEFEKNFPQHGDDNRQHQFLGLFDGASSQRRLYIVTVNDLFHLSGYLINRPGRFHYHLRFDYPDADQTRQYLNDQAPGAIPSEVEKAVAFSRKVNLNFDHLRAIAFELDNQEIFADVIGELNIKRVGQPTYKVEVKMSCGTEFTRHESFDLFTPDDGDSTEETLVIYDRSHHIGLSFDVSQARATGNHLTIPVDAVTVNEKSEGLGDVQALTLSLVGQQSIGY